MIAGRPGWLLRSLREIRAYGVWWLSPAGAVLLVIPSTILLAVLTPAEEFATRWRTTKVLQADFAWLLATGALIMVVASLLPLLMARRPPTSEWPYLSASQHHILDKVGTLLFRLTLFGYLALAMVGVARGARPQDLVDVLLSQNNIGGDLKPLFAPVAGITTFTQMGIAYVVVGSYLYATRPCRTVIRRLVIVLGLAILRAYFLSERLAILELLVPMLAIGSLVWLARGARSRQAVVQLAPVVLVPAVIGVFAVFEFSRSWVWYRENGSESFSAFVVNRLGGYYATAYNNGQLMYDYQWVPGRVPYRSIDAFWSAPGIEQLGLYDILERVPFPSSANILLSLGNPEFNSPCGICDPYVDWGPVGGAVFLASIGVLLGLSYVSFTAGRPVGLLLYPPLVTGLLELPRYIYWTSGRLLPPLLALGGTAVWLAAASSDRRSGSEPSIGIGPPSAP